MKIRAYDKSQNMYFQSEVYAKINTGIYERYLLSVPCETGDFIKFFDTFEISESGNLSEILINIITAESFTLPEYWIHRKPMSSEEPSKYKKLKKQNLIFSDYWGVSYLYEDAETLLSLLKGESVPVKGSIFDGNITDNRAANWNYIETTSDIENLFQKVLGFHDSVINKIDYVSGAFGVSKNSMYSSADIKRVTITFDSPWCNPVELIFEGVTALNLRPPKDNYFADIFDASMFIEDTIVYFFDSKIKEIDTTYEGTWISAYGLRWRFLPALERDFDEYRKEMEMYL